MNMPSIKRALLVFTALISLCAAGHSAPGNTAPAAAEAGPTPAFTVEVGHRAEVNQLAFSPDSKLFASASEDQTVIVRNAMGAWQRTLRGHKKPVQCLAFAADSIHLASADSGSVVLLWNAVTGALVRSFYEEGVEDVERKAGVLRVAFSHDGKVLAAISGGGTIRLWNTGTGVLRARIESHIEQPTLLSFSADAKTLIAGSITAGLQKFDTQSGQQQALFDDENAPGVIAALSPDARRMAFRAARGQLIVWDAETSTAITTIGPPRAVSAVEFAPDGETLLGLLSPNLLVLWNHKGEILQAFETGTDTPASTVASLTSSSDGKTVALANRNVTVKIWDLKSGKLQARLPAFRLRATHVLSGTLKGSNTDAIIGGYTDGSLFVWDARTGHLVKTLRNPERTVTAAALSCDGSLLAFSLGWQSFTHTMETQGVPYQEIQLWDTQNWTLLHTIKLIGHHSGVASLAFSPDGQTLAGGTNALGYDSVRLWDVKSGNEKSQLDQRGSLHPKAIAYSPDGKLLAASSESGSGLQIWDLATNSPLLKNINGASSDVRGVTFLPGAQVAVAGSYGFRIFDIGTQKWLPATEKVRDAGNAIALSPDGATLANSTQAGSVKLWDAATWQFKGYLEDAGSNLLGARAIAFTSDNRKLVVDNPDGSLKVWDIADKRLVATLQILPAPDAGSDTPEWITWTPSGFYAGSPGAAKFVHPTRDANATTAAIEQQYLRPEQVQKALNPAPEANKG